MVIRHPRDENEMLTLGYAVGKMLCAGDLVLVDGPLGAGKTTFAKGVGIALGLNAQDVRSPTYSILELYPTQPRFAHSDLYRLSDQQLPDLGLSEIFDPYTIGLVEWGAHKLPRIFPRQLEVTIAIGTGGMRDVQLIGRSTAMTRRLKSLT